MQTEPTGPAGDVRRVLEEAAHGLLYTSEGDYPFDFVVFPGAPEQGLTPAAFGELAGRPGEPVREVGLDDFFARHIERVDPADAVSGELVPRFRALREALRTQLKSPRVFRIGETEVHCYVVGAVPGGTGGLHTVAIET